MATPTPEKTDRGTNTSEYKAVQKNHSTLVQRLQHCVLDVANKFLSANLIGYTELNGALTQEAQPAATAIMISIMAKIDGTTEWYTTLIKVLQNSDLKDIAEEIEASKKNLEENPDKYTPMTNTASKTAPSLPPQSAYNPTPGSAPGNKPGPLLKEYDSAFSESQTEGQDGDEIGNSASPTGQNQADSNKPSFLKENNNYDNESIEHEDRTKDDMVTGLTSDHALYRQKMAELNLEKDMTIKYFESQFEEGNKKLVEKEELVSKLKKEMSKKDNVIENLQEDQAQKDEEIKRLRDEKEAVEIKLRRLSAYHEAKEKRRVEEVKAEYQAKIDSLTKQLEEAEKEKTKALERIKVMKKELEEERKKEELAQIEIERMNTKLVQLKLDKQTEIHKYQLKQQSLESQIEKESEIRKAEMAIKDKEIAEAKQTIEVMKNKELTQEIEKLQKQLEESKLDNTSEFLD